VVLSPPLWSLPNISRSKAFTASEVILWSIYAELGDYSPYPTLLVVARRIGRRPFVGGVTVVSVALTLRHLDVSLSSSGG
jgi:hypothetical protein